jgi:hypothetical protein
MRRWINQRKMTRSTRAIRNQIPITKFFNVQKYPKKIENCILRVRWTRQRRPALGRRVPRLYI